jgi:hypothetical protein
MSTVIASVHDFVLNALHNNPFDLRSIFTLAITTRCLHVLYVVLHSKNAKLTSMYFDPSIHLSDSLSE